jgi:hypothetical protein
MLSSGADSVKEWLKEASQPALQDAVELLISAVDGPVNRVVNRLGELFSHNKLTYYVVLYNDKLALRGTATVYTQTTTVLQIELIDQLYA